MALMKEKAITKKCRELAVENEELSKDIGELEELLASHIPGSKDRAKSQQGSSKSIWMHGKKGQLHGYKSSSSSLSESAICTNRKSNKGTLPVNRSATATKVKVAVENDLKSENCNADSPVLKQNTKVGPKRSDEVKEKLIEDRKNPAKERKGVVSSFSLGDVRQQPEKSPAEIKDARPKGQVSRTAGKKEAKDHKTQDTKAVVLEKLIKKAGVEEKLKEFKSPTEKSQVDIQHGRETDLKPTQRLSTKPIKEKKIQSSVVNQSVPVRKSTKDEVKVNRTHDPKTVKTSSSETSKLSKVEAEKKDTKGIKGTRPKSNITNQKRKQILSENLDQGTESPKAKPDEEVEKWLGTLKLTDTKKYIDIFAENEINMQNARLLKRTDLREIGINALGPLNAICNAVDTLNIKCKEAEQPQPKKPKKGQLRTKSKTKLVVIDQLENDGKSCEDKDSDDSKKEPKDTGVTNTDKKPKAKERSTGIDAKHSALNVGKTSPTPNKKVPKKEAVVKKPVITPAPKHDPTAIDPKILRRPPSARQSMAMSVAHIALPNEPNDDNFEPRPPTSSLGTRKSSVSNKSEVDVILNEMCHQIEALQMRSDSDPATRQLVETLQNQMQEIQLQVSTMSDEVPIGRPTSAVRPKTAGAKSHGPVLSALQGNMRPKKSTPLNMDDACEESKDTTFENKPISNTMSKQAILKEVRKQKDDFRKQIRHLESELSRIKHQDPLNSCEIVESDVLFSETDLIGEGAFSCVFHGSYQRSAVAVKQLKIPLSSQDKNYFAAEVQLLRELRHPQVVLLMGVCTTSRLPLMVLEYMNGGSLFDYLHNPQMAPLDHAAYFQIARDISLGMNYLHLHRPSVLHLDLKSMNVLLNQHMRAKIADFGFSKLKHEADVANQSKVKEGVKGTPAWMAPELLDAKQITAKADVYSFGIVLWEMITRKQPYQGCSTFQVLERVRNNKRPEIPDQCPLGLSRLITKCWDQNPGKRYSFKDIVSCLDELYFPTEWRQLFKVAGVPSTALEDIQASRTLINIVTHTVEDSGVVAEDSTSLSSGLDQRQNVEKLDLNFLEPQATFRKIDEARASQAWSEINLISKQSPPPQNENPYNFSIAVGSDGVPSPPPVPPLPPPPPLNNTSSKPKSDVTISFQVDDLLNQKSRLRHRDNLQQKEAVTDHTQGAFKLEASELVQQKDQLKSTSVPHPNQLTDLSTIHPERLSGIADLLKKVVNERRIVIETKESLDASMSESSWSNYED